MQDPTVNQHLKYCWLKVICSMCQSNELKCEIKHATWGPSWEPDKNLRGMAHPDHPLESLLGITPASVTFRLPV